MSDQYVYVAEAYKDGDRIAQLVHKNRIDAREDIEVSTNLDNPDRTEIHRKRLYLGQDDEFTVTK
jgi:hypothetical protein